jgi:hypothetical protein
MVVGIKRFKLIIMKIIQLGTNNAQDDLTKIIMSHNPSEIELLVLVEPQEIFNDSIKNVYKDYDFSIENKIINLEEDKKYEIFYTCVHKHLSSLKKENIENHGLDVPISEVIYESMTINKLFEKYNVIDLDILFVDVEGMDDKIISSIDFDKISIKQIYYEFLHIDDESFINFLNTKGYEVHKDIFSDGYTSLATKKI